MVRYDGLPVQTVQTVLDLWYDTVMIGISLIYQHTGQAYDSTVRRFYGRLQLSRSVTS